MAKLQLPAGWGLSGKDGGTVYSRNRFGAYTRTKVIPVNPNTPAQAQARGRLAAGSTAWLNLTAAQRSDWEVYASNTTFTDVFGNPYNLTGRQAFIRTYAFIARVGGTLPTDRPSDSGVPAPAVFPDPIVAPTADPTAGLGVSASDSTQTGLAVSTLFIDYSQLSMNEDTADGVLLWAYLKSPASNFHKSPWIPIDEYSADISTPVVEIDLASIGLVPAAGERLFLQIRYRDQYGRVSSFGSTFVPAVTFTD